MDLSEPCIAAEADTVPARSGNVHGLIDKKVIITPSFSSITLLLHTFSIPFHTFFERKLPK